VTVFSSVHKFLFVYLLNTHTSGIWCRYRYHIICRI